MTDFAAAYARLGANTRGALWMVAAALTFTAMTTLIKFLGDDYSPALQAFYRQAAGLVVLLPLIARQSRQLLRTTRPWLLTFRALGTTAAMVLGFYAYQELPLADANALSFTRTLWMVPLAAFVLHEPVGAWRTGATLAGFAGVIVMLQPTGSQAAILPAAAALGSAAIFAATVTGMKIMTRDHTAMQLTVWAAVLGFFLSAPLALLEWRWPTVLDFALLSAMGVIGLITQFCYIKGMSLGDAAAMAPLDYTRLIFAILVGFVVFHEVPSAVTMLGACIVIAATLLITIREARTKRLEPAAPD